jgi:hypothetical protein
MSETSFPSQAETIGHFPEGLIEKRGKDAMKKTARIVLSILASLFIASPCARAQEASPPPETAETPLIRAAVADFYAAAQGGSNVRNMDARLISQELRALIQLAIAVERRNTRQVAASDNPTAKPRLLEGAVFTPHYEGYSRLLAIRGVRKDESTYWQGWAEVELIYDPEPPALLWRDRVSVVLEDGRWRVDDIRFGVEPEETESVKQILHDFAGIGDTRCERALELAGPDRNDRPFPGKPH